MYEYVTIGREKILPKVVSKKKNNKFFILLKSQMDQVACSGRQLSGCQFVFIALTQTATAATLLVANDKSTHRLSRRLKHAKLLHYKLF